MKRGVAAVEVLDAIAKPRLEDQPELQRAWKNVKRGPWSRVVAGVPVGRVTRTSRQ